MRPALVIFDMDDVLCHYQLGKRLRFLAELANTTARDVRAAVWDSGFEDAADSGGYSDPEEYLQANSPSDWATRSPGTNGWKRGACR